MKKDAHIHRVVPRRRAALIGARRKEALRLVKHEHRVLPLGLDEDLFDVLRALANILVHQLRAVDDHQRPADVKSYRLGRHGLARSRLSVEEGRDALGAPVLLLEAPLPKEDGLRLRVVDNLLEVLLHLLGEHHLLQAVLRHDAAIEIRHRQPAAQLVRRARVQVLHCHGRLEALTRAGDREGREPRVLDESSLQLVLAREQHEVDVRREGQLGRGHDAPDLLAEEEVGLGELDREGDAPVHGLVEVHRPVGREDTQPLVALELGEHRVHLHVALGAVHEDRLALVEEEDCAPKRDDHDGRSKATVSSKAGPVSEANWADDLSSRVGGGLAAAKGVGLEVYSGAYWRRVSWLRGRRA